jgi:hypothetical protein
MPDAETRAVTAYTAVSAMTAVMIQPAQSHRKQTATTHDQRHDI